MYFFVKTKDKFIWGLFVFHTNICYLIGNNIIIFSMNISERSKHILWLDHYGQENIPEEVCSMDLNVPQDKQYVLRCLIRDTFSGFQIPESLLWCKPLIDAAEKYQRDNVGIRHSFCYLTVRSWVVESVTDDEWHVDWFAQRINHIPEQNYTWTDHTPTEFVAQDIVFPEDFDWDKHNIHRYIQDNISDESEIQSCKEKTLYCMDPYVIHRRPNVTQGTQRTFVRISFLPIEINDINNTQNPLLPREYTRDWVTSFRDKLLRYVPNK